MAAFTSASNDATCTWLVLTATAVIGAAIGAVGAVVGRLMLAARRDDEERAREAPSKSSQDWYQ
ncbi:MAG: hypothetical protein LH645_00190 [Actinomycetia bacterium]|nr:hypothetical protein [Actinomycetes bacterium]